MKTARTREELRSQLDAARRDGRRIALVPTMGFLHEGHLRLCDLAREHGDVVIMTIFVNPLQFGPGEDLARYPRDIARDTALAEGRGVDVLFTPDAAEMYPSGDARVRVHAPGLDAVLCGRYRPGHFEGVLTVVAKLFNLVRPDTAVFGQKDLQQLTLIRRMTRDLDFDLRVVAAPITREPDGLAMSSRNIYLDPAQRRSAVAIHRALDAAQRAFSSGTSDPAEIVAAALAILRGEPGVEAQYVELVDEDLQTPVAARAGHAVATAAHVGSTRLIDNHILT